MKLHFDKSFVWAFSEPQSMHPEENGAVADRFQSKPPECTAAAKLFTKWICELATKRKCFDHDAAGREPEETGRRSRFCVAKILTMPIYKANFPNMKKISGFGVKPQGFSVR